ncbi:MAG: ParA family protein [Oscillospiraceae bacterium]|jgi:chromosome partitioning protein|nr:ParA family protein [Oscillospiraceae bacterium]
MAKIIAVTNQKGGVGKTTTAVNLCAALSARGRSVLLCDMDPQANATSGLGVDKAAAAHTTYDVLLRGVPAADAVVATAFGGVIPANQELSGGGIELVGLPEREFVLKTALGTLRGGYDYIFIDCPPSLEMLTLNSLCAADSVLIPVQCEYFALEGLADLITTIRMIKRGLNPALEIEGVLLTMLDSRTNFSAQVASEIKKFFGKKVYAVTIPRNVRIAEAPSHGQPVVAYDASSRGAEAYRELAREFDKRAGGG